MVVIYYRLSSVSCRKASFWFQDRDIKTLEKRIGQISKKDLLQALRLSGNGFLIL